MVTSVAPILPLEESPFCCFPQHLFREEYLSGDTGGICVVFSLSKGTGPILIRDDEKGGERVGGVLSVFFSVPLVRKTILLPFPSCHSKP